MKTKRKNAGGQSQYYEEYKIDPNDIRTDLPFETRRPFGYFQERTPFTFKRTEETNRGDTVYVLQDRRGDEVNVEPSDLTTYFEYTEPAAPQPEEEDPHAQSRTTAPVAPVDMSSEDDPYSHGGQQQQEQTQITGPRPVPETAPESGGAGEATTPGRLPGRVPKPRRGGTPGRVRGREVHAREWSGAGALRPGSAVQDRARVHPGRDRAQEKPVLGRQRWVAFATTIGKTAGVHVGDELTAAIAVTGLDPATQQPKTIDEGQTVKVVGIGSGVTVRLSNGNEVEVTYSALRGLKHKAPNAPAESPPAPTMKSGDAFIVQKAAGPLPVGAELRLVAPAVGGGFWCKLGDSAEQFSLNKAVLENMALTGVIAPKGAGAAPMVNTIQPTAHWKRLAQKTQAKEAQRQISSDEFEKEIQRIAKEIFDRYIDENGSAPTYNSDGDMSDWVHEEVDGHQWIIYNAYNDDVNENASQYGCKDPDISDFLDTSSAGDDPDEFCSKVDTVRAFAAMECSVYAEIQNLIDNYEEPEEKDDEDDDGSTPSGVPTPAGPSPLVPKLQQAYDAGQKAPSGSPPPAGLTPGEVEAFRRGAYDRWGGGFGPPPNLHRQIVDADEDGLPRFASRRIAAREAYEVLEQLDALGPNGKGTVPVPAGSKIYLVRTARSGHVLFSFAPNGPAEFAWEPGMLEGLHDAGSLMVADDDTTACRMGSKEREHPYDKQYGGEWDSCEECYTEDRKENFAKPGLCYNCAAKKKDKKDKPKKTSTSAQRWARFAAFK